MLKFSRELESKLAKYRADYRLIVNDWLESGAFGITYPALLVETFHYVRHSCSLMNYACAQLGHESLPLQIYFARHIAEEVGHEEWLLNDLEKLGYNRLEVEASPPLAETINLVGSQLYVINYLHPAGLLGYVYLMESTPPSKTSLAFLEAYGVKSGAMTFLSRHGQEDQRHRRELRDTLDTHFTEPRIREAAILSAVMGLSNVNRLLARVKRGKYADCFPETTTASALAIQTHFPSIIIPLSLRPSRNGGHEPSNQTLKRRNQNVAKAKQPQRAISAGRKKHAGSGGL